MFRDVKLEEWQGEREIGEMRRKDHSLRGQRRGSRSMGQERRGSGGGEEAGVGKRISSRKLGKRGEWEEGS